MKKLLFLALGILLSACSQPNQNAIIASKGQDLRGSYIDLISLEDKTLLKNISANDEKCVIIKHQTPYESEDSYHFIQNDSSLKPILDEINSQLEESLLIVTNFPINLNSQEFIRVYTDEFNCNNVKNLNIQSNKGAQTIHKI